MSALLLLLAALAAPPEEVAEEPELVAAVVFPADVCLTNACSTKTQPDVDLRGMGSGRTLALVNGRRLGDMVAEPGFNEALAEDISAIPMEALQQVEVLRERPERSVPNFLDLVTELERNVAVRTRPSAPP